MYHYNYAFVICFVSAMNSKLNLENLEKHSKGTKVIIIYRIVNNLVTIPAVVLIQTMSIRGNLILVPYARTIMYNNIIFPRHHLHLEHS